MKNQLEAFEFQDELFREPIRIVPPDPWVGHIPFAFWVVKALQPETFVELGAHSGNSYAAFCQAIASSGRPAKAFAVDTWKGDEHSGAYGEEVYADLVAFNDTHFQGFSTLIRDTFDNARRYFSSGTIDLLHIDGMHTYDAVKHDFETWLDALSSRALVVFHDINVRERGFGVWQLWLELAERYPSFEFIHSHGLGVLGVGDHQAELLSWLFEIGHDPGAAARLQRVFSSRGELLWRRAQIVARDDRIDDLTVELTRWQQRIERQNYEIAWRDELIRSKEALVRARDALLDLREDFLQSLSHAVQARDRILAAQDNSLRQQDESLRQRDVRIAELEAGLIVANREQQLAVEKVQTQFLRSTSWRMTEPLRRAGVITQRLLAREPHAKTATRLAAVGNVHQFSPAPALPAGIAPEAAPAETARSSLEAAKLVTRSLLSTRLDAFLAGIGRLSLPTSNRPSVSILLILYNQAELTLACLSSITETLSGLSLQVEVVILDNGSSDRTIQLLTRIDGAKVIRSSENLHFLRGINRAAQEATGRFLLLLKSDTQLVAGTVEAAVRTLEGDPTIGAVGGRLILPDGSLQEAGSIVWNDGACVGYGQGRNPSDPEFMFRRDVDYCSAAFLMTPRAAFEKLGGFDERYAPAYYEDTDYCVRLWQQGLRVVFDPNVSVLHYESGSATQEDGTLELQRQNGRLFALRHRGWLSDRFPPSAENILDARIRSTGIRVLMIDERIPKMTLGAGYPRANDLLHELVAAGAQVTFFPDDQV